MALLDEKKYFTSPCFLIINIFNYIQLKVLHLVILQCKLLLEKKLFLVVKVVKVHLSSSRLFPHTLLLLLLLLLLGPSALLLE